MVIVGYFRVNLKLLFFNLARQKQLLRLRLFSAIDDNKGSCLQFNILQYIRRKKIINVMWVFILFDVKGHIYDALSSIVIFVCL